MVAARDAVRILGGHHRGQGVVHAPELAFAALLAVGEHGDRRTGRVAGQLRRLLSTQQAGLQQRCDVLGSPADHPEIAGGFDDAPGVAPNGSLRAR